ncbi:DNA gyrase inhibitor YacG [Geobacter luticola]|uniref:DNA gyrase inhibitor YacG n=2 Tax=Geomobilimonas luticola TaxID=1114878 RepID=A0ABS5SBJ7_9BACT|nr:DNA gyrase inhibitor YacG [Geomobilimonas luticola]MBT0652747.1 DNA gyrase inhibitor YacG [Geomobilimonas luticola]
MPKMVKCPHCGRDGEWTDNPFRPFCSERCRMTDLGGWLSEEYRIAGDERPSGEDQEEE